MLAVTLLLALCGQSALANPITVPSVRNPTTSTITIAAPRNASRPIPGIIFFETPSTAPAVLTPQATPTVASSQTTPAGSLGTPSAAPAPMITPAPEDGLLADGKFDPELAIKFRQTTYYSCVTWPHTVHCGWHEPILDASMPNAAARFGGDSGVLSNNPALRAAAIAAGAGLLLGFRR